MKELIIPNGDRNIYGVLFEPSGEVKHPAIILSHGYNGSHADWVNEGRYYSDLGYAVYAFDFCGGSVNSRSSAAKMTITSEKEDLLAVFAYIKNMDNVDETNIVLFGASQGGFVSSLAAAELGNKVSALALYYPALCIPDDWRKHYPDPDQAPDSFDFWGLELSRKYIEDVHRMDVYEKISGYKGKVIILHGDKDEIVPYSYSEKAAEVYENAKLVRMEGEGHGFSPEGGRKAMEIVLDFLKQE